MQFHLHREGFDVRFKRVNQSRFVEQMSDECFEICREWIEKDSAAFDYWVFLPFRVMTCWRRDDEQSYCGSSLFDSLTTTKGRKHESKKTNVDRNCVCRSRLHRDRSRSQIARTILFAMRPVTSCVSVRFDFFLRIAQRQPNLSSDERDPTFRDVWSFFRTPRSWVVHPEGNPEGRRRITTKRFTEICDAASGRALARKLASRKGEKWKNSFLCC